MAPENDIISIVKKLSAILIAIAAGAYLALCQTKKSTPKIVDSYRYKQTKECKDFESKIKQRNFYLSTSKAAPSTFENKKLDDLQKRYDDKCRIK